MKLSREWLIFWSGLFALGLVPSVWAAKYGVVMIDSTPVVSSTAPDAQVLENLARGATVGASDEAYGGYYRVRTRAGNVGWIAADRLTLRDYPTGSDGQGTAAAASPASNHSRFLVRAFGGVRFLGLTEIASTSRFPFGPSFDFGGAFSFLPLKWLAVTARAEYLFNALVGQDTATTFQYSFYTQAVPIMGGVEFLPLNTDRVALRMGAFAGYAPLVSHTVNDISSPGTGVLALSSMAFTALGQIELAIKLGKLFQIQIDSGYRFLTTSALSTQAATGNTPYVYNNTAVPINMGGIFIQIGVGLGF